MENTLVRSSPCAECGAEMLWTQNAWKTGDTGRAAYCCLAGHVVDPSTTRQCPTCGIHDTVLVGDNNGRTQSRCARCNVLFDGPA
jgi:hypothetical protein